MIGLYVHIPFCSKKCYYCDFASYEKVEYLMDEYVDAVLSELDKYKQDKFDQLLNQLIDKFSFVQSHNTKVLEEYICQNNQIIELLIEQSRGGEV